MCTCGQLLVRLLACMMIVTAWASAAEPVTRVVMETSFGNITLLLDSEQAPITVANFLSLAEKGFYNGTVFHRVVVGFVVQGGGYDAQMAERELNSMIRSEADNGLQNTRGTIAMARNDEIDSASNQFFINMADNSGLDHTESSCTRARQNAVLRARKRGIRKPGLCTTYGYAVFGRVISGMEVLDDIELVDTKSANGFDDLPIEPIVIRSIHRL